MERILKIRVFCFVGLTFLFFLIVKVSCAQKEINYDPSNIELNFDQLFDLAKNENKQKNKRVLCKRLSDSSFFNKELILLSSSIRIDDNQIDIGYVRFNDIPYIKNKDLFNIEYIKKGVVCYRDKKIKFSKVIELFKDQYSSNNNLSGVYIEVSKKDRIRCNNWFKIFELLDSFENIYYKYLNDYCIKKINKPYNNLNVETKVKMMKEFNFKIFIIFDSTS